MAHVLWKRWFPVRIYFTGAMMLPSYGAARRPGAGGIEHAADPGR